MALNAKQKLFVREYIIDLNGKQAAIRAGYSKNTAAAQASRLLTNANVQKAVDDAKAERLKRLNINADYVLQRMVEVDQMDYADILDEHGFFKPVEDWPLIWRQFIGGMDIQEHFDYVDGEKIHDGYIKKIKMPDRLKNLELMGKHVKVQAFLEKTKDTGLESLAEAIRAGRRRTGNDEEDHG